MTQLSVASSFKVVPIRVHCIRGTDQRVPGRITMNMTVWSIELHTYQLDISLPNEDTRSASRERRHDHCSIGRNCIFGSAHVNMWKQLRNWGTQIIGRLFSIHIHCPTTVRNYPVLKSWVFSKRGVQNYWSVTRCHPEIVFVRPVILPRGYVCID